jgi:hypothetical protein
MQHTTVAQAVLIMVGFATAGVRLLTASRPIWGKSAPARWATVILPAVLVGLGALPPALANATSLVDVAVAIFIAVGAGFAASQGPKGPTAPPSSGAGSGGPTLSGPGPVTIQTWPNSPDEPAELSDLSAKPPLPGWRLALVSFALLGCSAAPVKPPCDPGTLAAITARCSAYAYACGQKGGSESECTKECDAELEKRAEVCRE